MKQAAGFTLLEVLVALGIFAVVAASVLVASAGSVRSAHLLQEKTLAMWVADNRLAELQLATVLASTDADQGRVELAGRVWQWQSEIQPTSEAAMQRATVWVATEGDGDVRERALVSLSGFVETP